MAKTAPYINYMSLQNS